MSLRAVVFVALGAGGVSLYSSFNTITSTYVPKPDNHMTGDLPPPREDDPHKLRTSLSLTDSNGFEPEKGFTFGNSTPVMSQTKVSKNPTAAVKNVSRIITQHPTDIRSGWNEMQKKSLVIANVPTTELVTDQKWELQREKSRNDMPAIRQLLYMEKDDNRIIGDASWLLDFAIIGFPKCGTSTLMATLHTNDTFVIQYEQCNLIKPKAPWRQVRTLHRSIPTDRPMARMGIKCPSAGESPFFLHHLAEIFPHTNVLIGIRHPVRWFESFYNFRFGAQDNAPHPRTLIGECNKENQWICTNRGNFHVHLARMGKTNLTSPEEKQLLGASKMKKFRAWKRLGGKVMLVHMEQMADTNATRDAQLRRDLEIYLQLHEQSLPPFVHIKPDRVKANNLTKPKTRIDICDSEYDDVREVVYSQGVAASTWIENFFLKSEDVFVSSPDYFVDLLRSWKIDPCKQGIEIGQH